MKVWKTSVAAFLAISAALLLAIWCLTQPFHSRYPAFQGASADPRLLRQHVEFLSSTAAPRDIQNPENLERAVEYISSSFTSNGLATRLQPYTAAGSTFKNVIATAGPRTGPTVVFCAHYDAATGTPGADDNASGIAGLLELARLTGEMKLTGRVEFAAVSTEEPPFFGTPNMGSHHYAEALKESGTDVRGAVVLEMIGAFGADQQWPSAAMRLLYPGPGNFIALAGRWTDGELVRSLKAGMRSTGMPTYSYTGPEIRELTLSDHRDFWRFGFRSVLVSDTAFFRNPNYHTMKDTPASLDYVQMARVVDGLASMLAWEAGRPPIR